MNYRECSHSILQFFHVLGLTSFGDNYPNDIGYSSNLLSNALITAQTLLSFGLSISCALYLNSEASRRLHSRTDIIMTLFFALCQVGRTFCTFIQSTLNKPIMARIAHDLQRFDSFCYVHMNHRIPYEQFHRRFASKAINVLAAYILFIALTVAMSVAYDRQPPAVFEVRFLQGISVLTLLHAIFFIDAIDFHLQELIDIVHVDSSVYFNTFMCHLGVVCKGIESKISPLRWHKYKVLYFRLWEVSQHINAYFAWYMAVMFLNFFVTFVYSSYWFITSCRQFSTGLMEIAFICCEFDGNTSLELLVLRFHIPSLTAYGVISKIA